jgi:predicted RND superfamily exporter protein
VGLLSILVATFLFLPTLLVFRERRLEKKVVKTKVQRELKDLSFVFLGKLGGYLSRKPLQTLTVSLLITIFLVYMAFQIKFDYNYLNMEPKGLTSVSLMDTILEKFDLSMDYAFFVTKGVDQSRQLTSRAKKSRLVAMVEDISLYFPSPQQQEKRIPYLRSILAEIQNTNRSNPLTTQNLNSLISQLERLEMNIVELQQMAFLGGQDKVDRKSSQIIGQPDNPKGMNLITRLITELRGNPQTAIRKLNIFQGHYRDYFINTVKTMANTTAISLQTLPESILDRYSNRERTKFLVTVYPNQNIWADMKFLSRFTDDLDRIDPRATGVGPVYRRLIVVIGRDGIKAAGLTVLIVFLLLLVDFRKLSYVVIAMIPLVVGVFWMVGFMNLIGQKLTVLNVMGIPLILGIGIDDGVHIIHRYRSEGRGSFYTVFSSTGKAILLTSLTTMIGFGSLIFSIWPGFASLGSALTIGVGMCFLTTVVVLPGILGWLEKRKTLNPDNAVQSGE